MIAKKWLAGFGLVSVFLLQSFMLNGNDTIRFREDSWSIIGKEAKSEEKMIFVYVTASWCGVCKKMDNVLLDEKIGEFYNQNFISTRFDADNGMQQYRASNWGVTAVPAMVFLDKNKSVVHRVQGYRDAAAMMKEAKIAARKK